MDGSFRDLPHRPDQDMAANPASAANSAAEPRGWRRALAIAGIVAGFLAYIVPGIFALGSYSRWRDGKQPRPMFAWVCAIVLGWIELAGLWWGVLFIGTCPAQACPAGYRRRLIRQGIVGDSILAAVAVCITIAVFIASRREPLSKVATVATPRQGQARRTNRAAIASFLLALLGIVPAVAIPSLLAIAFGMVALRRIKRSGGRRRGLAVAGILLGLAGIVWTILFMIGMSSMNGNNLP